jgi:hypothetical protein
MKKYYNKIINVVFFNSYLDISKSFILNEEEETYNFEDLKKLSEDIKEKEVFSFSMMVI